jgi:hypothetical protein
MVQKIRRGIAALGLAAALAFGLAWPAGAQRVVVVSFDGLGHEFLTTEPTASELTVFQRLRREGVTAAGVQPHFPSTTSNSHAALFTGAYGDVSNITSNSMPILPRKAHRFTDRGVGFRSDQLAAEPFWVTAARQGKRAVAHQATQAFPFREFNTRAGAVVVNGYQTRTLAGWQAVELKEGVAAEWEAGPWRFRAEVRGGVAEVEELTGSGGRVKVKGAEVERWPPRGRGLARRFSEGLFLDHAEHPVGVHFRLFRKGGGWLLVQSPAQELGLHDGERRNDGEVRRMLREEGGSFGNGAAALLRKGILSEAEYLETVELQIRQTVRHAGWLDRRFRPDLLQSYVPFPDEMDHVWLGREGPWRAWAYAAVDEGARGFARLAGRKDHLVFVSDHGMARVERGVNVNEVLKRAGLAGRAIHLYNSVLVNTTDWKEGVVKAEERGAVVAAIRSALEGVRDPDTGAKVVTAFFTPEEHGALYGIGGPAGADLYFDLLPGWRVVDGGKGEVVVRFETPSGTHGFDPLRWDMLAICVGRGPRLRRGGQWERLRSVQIAPLVMDLLGVGPPRDARGVSPLALQVQGLAR